MLATVTLGSTTFVLDPGFGGGAPRVPVPLREHAPVTHEDETHWLVRDEGHWVLKMRAGDAASDCWASMLERDNLVDFEMSNHFTSTYPASPFVNRLLLQAYVPGGRIRVMNRDVTESRHGRTLTRTLASRSELRALVAETMDVDLPELEALRIPSVPEWH